VSEMQGNDISEPKPYWVSFESYLRGFEYHGPWWISGETEDGAKLVCAAVMATDEEDARHTIYASFDEPHYEGPNWFRFVEVRPASWNPFGDRFPKADWMKWPWPT